MQIWVIPLFLAVIFASYNSRAASIKISNLTTGDNLTSDISAGMTVGIKYSIGDSLKIEWGRPNVNSWRVSERGEGFGPYGIQLQHFYNTASDSSSLSIAGSIQVGGVSITGTSSSTTTYSLQPVGDEVAYPTQTFGPPYQWSSGLQSPVYSFLFVAQQTLPFQMAIVSSASANSWRVSNNWINGYNPAYPSVPFREWSSYQDFYSGSESLSFTLVPEPSSLSLLLAGGALLFGLRNRLKSTV